MRRLIIAVPVFFLVAGAAAAGWHFLRPRDALAEARQLQAQGDLRAAQLVLRGAVQADPARAEAHLRLGQVQLRLGDAIAAERELRAAGERGWDKPALQPLLAQAVVAQHRNEEVLRDYTPDGLLADQAAAVLVARAQAQLELGRPEQAAASVAEAQRLAPRSVETALAAAKLAVARNDRAAAEAHAAEALAIDPHVVEALTLQAELHAARGDQAGALELFEAALQQASPGQALAIRLGRAGLLTAAGQDAPARSDLDVILKAQPKNPMAQYLSARLFVRAGDWKAADAALAEAGPALERLPEGDLTLAVVKANLGQPEQAVAAAERQVARAPDDLAAIKLLARLDQAGKLPEQAIRVLSAASVPLDAEALELLGDAYAATGQPTRAAAALRRASALKPDDGPLLTRLAGMELRQGDAAQAAQALGQALKLQPAAPAGGQTGAQTVALTKPGTATDAPAATPATGPTPAQTAAALVLVSLQAGDIDRAVGALDRLRAANADPAQIALLGGLVKLAQTDFDGAKAGFEEAARLDPKAPAPRVNLARVLAMRGQSKQAITLLDGVLAGNPAETDALGLLVNLHMQAEQPDKATAAAEAALRAAPGNPGIVAGLGSLYLRAKQPDKVLALLNTAEKPGQESVPPLLILRAQAQLALNQRAEAVQTLRTLLDRQPDNATLRGQIADVLAQGKQYDDARTLLREGLARRPGEPTLIAATVNVAEREGGPDAARARAEDLAGNPASGAPATLLGDVLMRQGRAAQAVTAYQAQMQKLPKDDPGMATLQVRMAEATAAAGDAAKAASLLHDWLAAHPDSPAATLALASLDLTANRLPQARTGLEQVLVSQPTNFVALNNLAWIAQQQGDLAQAQALAERAYLLAATPQSADTLGWIVLAQGHAADALPLLRAAALALPADPAIQYHHAAALAQAGQKDAAVSLLKTVLDKPAAGFSERPQAAKLLASLSAH